MDTMQGTVFVVYDSDEKSKLTLLGYTYYKPRELTREA